MEVPGRLAGQVAANVADTAQFGPAGLIAALLGQFGGQVSIARHKLPGSLQGNQRRFVILLLRLVLHFGSLPGSDHFIA